MTNSPEQRPRVALVTGAARGIGRTIARSLLQAGYRVHAIDSDTEALDGMYAGLDSTLQAECRVSPADVSRESDVARCVAAIRADTGRLDLLINNAGIADPFNAPIESLALADWQRVIDVNLTGFFICAKHSTPLLRGAGGSIVNMASTRAYQSEPHSEAYAASKGGIIALTHALAISLGPQVRVNAIAPGWIDVRDEQAGGETPEPLRAIDHEQHPAGRVGRAADIARLVVYLASPQAQFITGQTWTVDGGMTRHMIYAH